MFIVSAHERNTHFLVCLSFHRPAATQFSLSPPPSTRLSLAAPSSLYFGVSCEIRLLLSDCSLQHSRMVKSTQMLHAPAGFAFNLYGGGRCHAFCLSLIVNFVLRGGQGSWVKVIYYWLSNTAKEQAVYFFDFTVGLFQMRPLPATDLYAFHSPQCFLHKKSRTTQNNLYAAWLFCITPSYRGRIHIFPKGIRCCGRE